METRVCQNFRTLLCHSLKSQCSGVRGEKLLTVRDCIWVRKLFREGRTSIRITLSSRMCKQDVHGSEGCCTGMLCCRTQFLLLSAVFVLSAVRACRCRFRLMRLLILIDPFKSRWLFLLALYLIVGKLEHFSLSAVCIKTKLLSRILVFFFIFLPFILIYFHRVISIAVLPCSPINNSCPNSGWEMSNKKINKTLGCKATKQRGEWRRAVQGCHFNSLCCNWLHFRSTVPHLNLFLFVNSCRSVCTEGENIIHSSMQLSQGWLSSHFSKSALQSSRKALGIQFLNAFVTCIIENPFKQIYWAKGFLYLD